MPLRERKVISARHIHSRHEYKRFMSLLVEEGYRWAFNRLVPSTETDILPILIIVYEDKLIDWDWS